MRDIVQLLERWQLDVGNLRESMYRASTPRERERWHGLWLLAQGWSATQVAEALEREPHTIGNWLANFRRAGAQGLEAREEANPCLIASEVHQKRPIAPHYQPRNKVADMYIRLVSRSLRPGHWDEFKSYFQDRYVPGTSETKGLQRRQLLPSTENPDEGISLSFWDTLEDLLAFERSPVRQELAQGLEEFYPALAYPMGDYWVKHFEIISTTRFQPEGTLT